MKAEWKDFKYGSWLVLVPFQIDAKIVAFDAVDPNTGVAWWGVILHPSQNFEVVGTLDEAKERAETALTVSLNAGLARLAPVVALRSGG